MSATEPLRVREGAIFTCHGDGLCCSDVHAWGPLDEQEAATLRALNPEVVTRHDGGELVILNKEGGMCIFSGEGTCALHAMLGPKGKPKTCQQFPFVLVATPVGGRIVTEHRCPCRTMGERAPITAEVGRDACNFEALDRVIEATLPLDEETEIDLPTWEAIEAPILRGEASLAATPFETGDWDAIGRELEAEIGTSRFARALRCFGAAVLDKPLPALGWDEIFDRAEARSSEGDPEAMLLDWQRDLIWSLDWAFAGSWRQTQIDLVSRAEIARRIARGLGSRPDRAMAEAIAVIELAGMSDDYQAFVATL